MQGEIATAKVPFFVRIDPALAKEVQDDVEASGMVQGRYVEFALRAYLESRKASKMLAEVK